MFAEYTLQSEEDQLKFIRYAGTFLPQMKVDYSIFRLSLFLRI